MESQTDAIYREFKKRFDKIPILVVAPARVNLIGEHTDYNNGYVMPAAIDKKIVLALAPNSLQSIRLFARDMDQEYSVPLGTSYEPSKLHWPNYILGVVHQLHKRGHSLSGFDCLFGGDIPIGSGLSSSAALEGGLLTGLKALFSLPITKKQIAEIGRLAENDFVGVQCGIMDQFANIFGRKDSVIKLDCRDLSYTYHPMYQENTELILFDTCVQRELASSEYNARREQCNVGVKILNKKLPRVETLRDVTPELLHSYRDSIPEVVFKRCKFVIEENERVQLASADLTGNNAEQFGKRMYLSHYGLRDLFEVSCKELDLLVETTEPFADVLGARMMGGGFGGCTINLVKRESADAVIGKVRSVYEEAFSSTPKVYRVKICEGTQVVKYPTGVKN